MRPAVPADIKTFVELLSFRAIAQADSLAFRFLSYPATGVKEETLTFKELDARARSVAAALLKKCKPGDRALMLYPSGIDFIVAYFGCLYAGVIAVPGYPPKRNQKLGRLKSLMQDCHAKVAMTDAQTQLIAAPQFAEVAELRSLEWLITDAPAVDTVQNDSGSDFELPQVCADDIAFLQYTSGSTGDPKGVMVTHANLMANSRSIYIAMGHGPDTVVAGWLPLFHDMGLIGNVLQPVYAGIPSTLMSPASFLQRPLRWLEAISKYRATTSGGPNFAYDLCVGSIKDEDLAQLDLRSWRLAFNGAEPIRPESLRAFSNKFSDCGFDPNAHYACYGMAETTLLITGAEAGKGARITHFDATQMQQNRAVPVDSNLPGSHELVSCGHARCGQEVLIVDPETLVRCAEGEVGEIWAHGDSNAKGYWQNAEASAATFATFTAEDSQGPYLRTGDLGFIHEQELYIAGRLKDVVIIRGMNHYPQDIELTAFEAHDAFMPNGAAVFTVQADAQEQLVIVLEVRRTHLRSLDPDALARAVQQAVVLQHELQVQSIVFIKPGQLPKTSSGKVQRQTCKQQFISGQIKPIARIDKAAGAAHAALQCFDRDVWEAQAQQRKLALVEDHLAALFEAYAKLPAGSIQRDVPVIGYGLDSLGLTQIAARVSDELDIALQVQHLFEFDTVTALALHLNAALQDPARKRQRIPLLASSDQRYPLSFAQQRMWFLMQYEPSALYNISGVLRIEGKLDINALDKSFQEIMRRHDALRTRFIVENFEPLQVVEHSHDWKLSVLDMSDRESIELDQAIDRELNFVFDLSEDILFRVSVYKRPDGACSLVICMHHIISDGWSISILMDELAALYTAYTTGQASSLPPLSIQYPDYAVWQHDYLTGETLQRQERYWLAQLQGVTPIALPLDKRRPAIATYAGNSIGLQIDAELTQQLKAFSKEQGVTLYMTLLTAFGVLLHKYSGQDDICVGTAIANRTMVETKNLMGFFVNTLALRANYGGDPLFRQMLQSVRHLTVDAYAHQDLPFEKVVDLVQTERNTTTSPLFQVMFVLQDTDLGKLSLPGLKTSSYTTGSKTSKFDITLELVEGAEGLAGHLEYKTDLFEQLTIERMAAHFKHLLSQIIKPADVKLSKLSLLDKAERHALLGHSNAYATDAFEPVCSHLLFEEQVVKTPHAIALQCDQQTLTYDQLNLRANQIAHYLVENGIRPDTLVGLCANRSLEMVVAMLGILKAGGAYVAFDPSYPPERLAYLLEDSAVEMVLTQAALAEVLPVTRQRLVFIDDNALFDAQSRDNLAIADLGLTPASLAYVIYTSGSTGNPKASLLMHKGLSNLAQAQQEFFHVNGHSHVIQFASFAFDAATSEIFMALCAGARLHIVSKEISQSGADLSEYVARNAVTHATLPPALLSVLDLDKWQSVSHLVVAGEHCPLGLMKKWAHGRNFYNAYGPSETTVCASMGQLTPESDVVHMGKPMRGVQLYVLDEMMQPAPIGVLGQLFVGGRGVGRGYLGRDQLSKEKFVDNPFGEGKLYATGDLTRWLNDGNLEFIGRIDSQVKLHGFRIELGEIEAALAKQPGIVDSIVIVHHDRDNNQRLVAYILIESGSLIADSLRRDLAKSIPGHMIPSAFIPIDQFPLTSNGKVDRARLPEPNFNNLNSAEYVAPRTSVEKELAAIWGELLKLDAVGTEHNFFDLGGHSLLAMRMVSQIRERWNIEFPIKHVFETQQLHALAALIEHASGGVDRTASIPALERIARDQTLPLSYAQQRLWIVNEIDASSAQYNMPAAIDIAGELNIIALESAFDAFIARHEIVRTQYAERDGLPYQLIRETVDFALTQIDLSNQERNEQRKLLDTLAKKEALKPFDLAQDLMLRASLVILSDQRYTLLVTMHHIASDGWSIGVLVKELAELYSAFAENRKAALPELKVQYADYAAWQRKILSGEKLQSLSSYWRGQLKNLPSVHNLPLDRARLVQPSHAGGVVTQAIAPAIVDGLHRLARENNATLFMVLHAAFASLLHRYSGESDIVLGTPVANRDVAELEPLVGLFVNTLVVRSDFSQDMNFLELLAQGKTTLLDAYDHQDMPFEMVVNELQVERSQSFTPLFQIMLAFQSSGENKLQLAGVESTEIRETVSATKFDLTLNALEVGQGLKLTWEYAKDLFDEMTIHRLSSHFANLLAEIVNAPAEKLSRLSLLDDEEKHCLLEQWNATATGYPTNLTLHQLFEAQVARTPTHTALVFEDIELTYAELNGRANQLARHLRSLGVGPDVPVGICVERSIDMVVGLYGILKAGGAYVPFDPAYPKDRLAFMLEDARPPVLLTQQHLLASLPATDITTFCLDTQWPVVETYGKDNFDSHARQSNLAYVIFTSGSTGRPKGVGIEHAGIVNRLQWMQEAYRLSAADRVLQKTPFSFDVSVWEFFWPLIEGATLVVAKPGGHQDVSYLSELIASQKITTLHFVPPMLEVFLSEAEPGLCNSLRQVMCSGQALPMELQQRFFAKLHGIELHNLYGPTEASVDVTFWQCRPDSALSCVPIGKPIANIQIHILDACGNPVPIGVAGELHIAGIGLARGYMNRPDLTAEKFIPNPFSKVGGARMYRSGDLARYLPDGNIEYLGRIDDQVKIRGFRIELGEIEAALAALPDVRDVIVLAREDIPGDRRLVAYVVPQDPAKQADVAALRATLLQFLPDYMVPTHIICIDSLPLTNNGKVDRKRLPEPDLKSLTEIEFVAPRDPVEEGLAAIWCELLNLDKVGIHHNFFDLGGHSLLAIQAISRIRESFGVKLKVADLFVDTSIEMLAKRIAAAPKDPLALPPVAPRTSGATVPLSLEQQSYWFLYEMEGGTATYNIPSALRLTGKLDIAALEKSFASLISRHESLRTLLVVDRGAPMQTILPAADFSLIVDSRNVNCTKDVLDRQIDLDARYVFNLEKEIPIRVVLHKLSDDDHVLTVLLHHTMADGWSLDILFRDLAQLYNAYAADRDSPLAQLPVQYGDYAVWQKQNLAGDYFENQVAYWRNKLKGVPPMINLPTDYPRPPVQSFRGKEVGFILPSELTHALNAFSRKHNTTLFNTLVAGLNVLLSRYSHSEDIAIGTAIANRSQSSLESLIGCFANTLVLRNKVDQTSSFADLVEQVKGVVFDAYEHADVAFDVVVDAVQPERSLGVPPIFQVMFRLHNQKAGEGIRFADIEVERLNIDSESAKLDLNFSLVEINGRIEGVIEYATDIFSEQTVARIASHFQTILAAAISDSAVGIDQLSVVTPEELEQVRQWNATRTDYPQQECMHHLFERAVERTPNKLAYVCGNDRFTYAELNARANRLAHFLLSRGVGPEVRVGVSVERSTWAGIGVLAVLKAGGTYVPLDVNYPKDRINRMLEVANPQIILTLSSVASLFSENDAEVICLDTGWDAIRSQPIENPPRIGADHSAYILFTSGTTGKPKGILVSHRSFRNMAVAHQWAGLHTPDSRVLQFASLSFSIALWGAFMAWVPGGTLYSVTAKQALPDEPLYDFLEESQITHVTWPVSLLSTMPIERMPASLRTVISSAEPCNDAVVEKWTRLGIRFLNMYGNSEVSIGSTLYEYRNVGEKLTIGKALPNTRMYLLDENLKQVPIGVIAEIHTAGVGLATCYVDDPAATAKSFLPNPFADGKAERLYKTGDLGRYLPNGEIEFIGREDFQVSIRGFRVELTEIEDVLRSVPGVLEVVVNSRDDQQGSARLVCFYTQSNDSNTVNGAELRKAVGERLPNYMVPSLFIALDAMPLTPNRKIDRLALQAYPINEGIDDQYLAPRTAVEKQLAAIWSGILGVPDIGIRHDFFELGGHSLLATRIVARIRAEFSIELSLQQFFQNSTIEGLAVIIGQANASYVESPIRILANRDNVPLSFAQQRLWFLDRYEENSNFYHMPSVLRIAGDLDAAALNRAFIGVIERHEVLRTNFIASEGRGYQKIHPAIDWAMTCIELQGTSSEEKEAELAGHIEAQLNTSFDLQADALLRVVLYRMDAGEYRLFINMHHIVGDGWSITVLINEISALYAAAVRQLPAPLASLPVQYADYASWQIEYLQGPVLAKQSHYWAEKLKDIGTISLPLDFDRPKNQTYHGDRLSFSINQSLLAALDALSTRQGTTLYMTMLGAFKVMLGKYSGDTDISIGTPIANRVRAEIEPLIGFFANTLVLRSDLDGDPEFTSFLQQVKDTTLEAYSHQDLPFEKVVDLVLPERDPSRSPLFQVSFSFQNQPDRSFSLPGVDISNIALKNKTSKFDLLLECIASAEGITGTFEYNTDLFKRETMQSYIAAYVGLLHSIVANPYSRLSQLSIAECDLSASRGELALADYPLLQALYGDAMVAADDIVHYLLLDDSGNPVPPGVIGKLFFENVQGTVEVQVGTQSLPLLASRFKARRSGRGLVLTSSTDDVALINQCLVYPRAVEQHLLAKPGVQDCHVSIRHHAQFGDQVVVFLVCDHEAPDADELTLYLRDAGFAGISVFACVKLGAMPLTRHGAVNARQLHKYAVHHQGTREAWANQLRQGGKVTQAVLMPQTGNERQSVSHLHDLLPAEARGTAGATAIVVGKTRKSGNESISSVPALVIGETLDELAPRPKVLADLIINIALMHADKGIDFYHADNSTLRLSYAQLLRQSQCVLTGLRQAGVSAGDKVLFQFDRNEDFIVAFWACALGGMVPVPVAAAKNYKASNPQTVKLAHAWKMMDQAIVLAGANTFAGACNIAKLEAIDDFIVHDITGMYACDPATDFHQGSSNDLALIMLTSGSTGLPKGVQLTHANLISRSIGSIRKNGLDSGMPSMNWMAMDHVGGIVYFHIRDICAGAAQVQADTDYILADPLRWLRLIDRHRISVTWAPNFAFSLIVDRRDELSSLKLDLSCLKCVVNAAEAIAPFMMQTFIELMQQFGMPEDAVRPGYGMSETSSGITYAQRLKLTYGSDDAVFVSVGGPIAGVNIRIADENDQVMMEGQSGRLQVSGVTTTRGYLGGDSVNQDVFTQDGWFKTGDLAFIQDGELSITGREKDVIIINGVNFYSHEIESAVETLPNISVSFTAACAVRRNGSNSDQLAVFFNTALKGDELLALIRNIRQVVLEKIGINPSYILPVEKELIPKTEIGKIQRTRLSQLFNKGEFDQALRALDIAEQNEHTLPDWFFAKAWVQKNPGHIAELPLAGADLVFADHAGCAGSLALPGQVIMVTRGQAYQESGDSYRINPGIQEHYAQLLASLARRSIVVARVINLWDYDAIDCNTEALLARATLSDAIGMYSAWYLAQAFAALEAPPPMRWIWCARNAQQVEAADAINPDKAATLALLKTLTKEFSWLRCRHVDFAGEQTGLHAAQLAREIGDFHADEEAAYRNGKRFALRLQRDLLSANDKRAMPIVAGAAYVISGGLGGIGYQLSKMLLKQFNAKLLLIGRTPLAELSAVSLDMLDDLADLGSVKYVGADICNHAAIEKAVDQAEGEWKQKLGGIFHLAGIAHEQAMAGQSIHSLHDALRAKTSGTRVLYNVCNQRTNTLFVNFSSVNGFFGGSGMAAYSIGNRYQEAFVEMVRANRNVNSVCLNWSLWHDTGMGSQYKEAESLSKALGFTPIPAAKGLFAMLAALYHGRHNLLVGLDDSRPNIRRLVSGRPFRQQSLVCYFAASQPDIGNDLAASTTLVDEFSLPMRVQYIQLASLPQTDGGTIDMAALRQAFAASMPAKAERIAPRDELEETLTRIASEIFGAGEPIGIKDNFFDVGANSLLIVKMHHEIQQHLNIEFPMVELFNSTTVEKLAIFLGQQGSQSATADAARSAGQERRAAMQRRNRSRERKTAR